MTWIFTIVLVKETRTIESIKKKKKVKTSFKNNNPKKPRFLNSHCNYAFFPKLYASKERHCQLET